MHKKTISVNSTATVLVITFCNTHSDFHMDKTEKIALITVGKCRWACLIKSKVVVSDTTFF